MSEGAIRLGKRGLGSHGDLLEEMRLKGVGTEAARFRLGKKTIGYVAAEDEANATDEKTRRGMPQRVPVQALKTMLAHSQLNVLERFATEELVADPRPGALRALLERAQKLEAPAELIAKLEQALAKSKPKT